MRVLNSVMACLLVLIMVSGCASNTRVHSDFDEKQDFSHFRTYNFSSATEQVDPDFHQLLGLTFSAAVEQQMTLRGYIKSDKPDMLIDVMVDVEDKSRAPNQVHACPSYTSSNNANISSSVVDGRSRGTYCRYTEGPVTITINDAEKNQALWKGYTHVRIDERERGVLLSAFISDDVRMMFADSPFNPLSKPEFYVEKDRVSSN